MGSGPTRGRSRSQAVLEWLASGRVIPCHFGALWRQGGRGYSNRATLSEGPSRASGRHERTSSGGSSWGVPREREEDRAAFRAARRTVQDSDHVAQAGGFHRLHRPVAAVRPQPGSQEPHPGKRIFERLQDDQTVVFHRELSRLSAWFSPRPEPCEPFPETASGGGDGVIHMRLLNIIQRMHLRQGLSIREIARLTGMPRIEPLKAPLVRAQWRARRPVRK